MKKHTLFFALLVLFFGVSNPSAYGQEYDDLYFNPALDVTSNVTSSTTTKPNTNAEQYVDNDGRTYSNDDDYYVDNEYEYASRIRRFRRPYYGYGYYSDFYVNTYYYNPYAPIVTIYNAPSWGFNPWRVNRRWANPFYDPYWGWSSWNSPYYNAWNIPSYSPWGWNGWDSWNGNVWYNPYSGGFNAFCPPSGYFYNTSNPILNGYYNGDNTNNPPVVNRPRRGTNDGTVNNEPTSGGNPNNPLPIRTTEPQRPIRATVPTISPQEEEGRISVPSPNETEVVTPQRASRRSEPTTPPSINTEPTTTTPSTNNEPTTTRSRRSNTEYNSPSTSPSRSSNSNSSSTSPSRSSNSNSSSTSPSRSSNSNSSSTSPSRSNSSSSGKRRDH